MTFEWSVGNFIALSGLAIRVYSAYRDAPDDYRNISEGVAALQILIDKVAQLFKSTPINTGDLYSGQKVLKSCQDVLVHLSSLIQKYESLLCINERVARAKLGKDIVALRERLISNIILLHGFVRSFEYTETRAQLAAILGLHHIESRISVTSIATFAVNSNTQAAYQQLYKELCQLGVTENMIRFKESKILDLLNSQRMVARNVEDQTSSTPEFRFTSSLRWSQSSSTMGPSSIQIDSRSDANPLMPEATGGDSSALRYLLADNSQSGTLWLLFGKGAAIGQNGNTLLHCAARDGYTDMVKVMLRKGTPLEAVNEDNNTPLHLAASVGHTGAVEVLLKKGASIEARGQDHNTPLHLSAQEGHGGVVGVLLEEGASTGTRNNHYNTPLHLAALRGHTAIVEVLLRKGASIDAREQFNNTPLHLSTQEGHGGVVGVLLEEGGSTEATNYYQNTPLHIAASKGHTAIVEVLLGKGGSIEARAKHGNTPLHLAASEGHGGVVGVLLEEGASAEATNNHNNTPLHLAASKGHTAIVEVLLGKGVSIEARGKYGNTPLHLAASEGHACVVEVLIRRGASIEAVNEYDTTPLQFAVSKGHHDIVRLLKESAAQGKQRERRSLLRYFNKDKSN